MFYYNLGYHFKLREGSPTDVPGSIISAVGMAKPQLERRKIKKLPYLQHRLFDPQLYLAGLDAHEAGEAVAVLATYPWFGVPNVKPYDSGQQSIRDWELESAAERVKNWPRAVPSGKDIDAAVREAIVFQRALGCEAIILPSPLTDAPRRGYLDEVQWLDTGIDVARHLGVTQPLFATIAIKDSILRGTDAGKDGFLGTITGQIATRREELTGAYLVIEQSSEDTYCCGSADVLKAVLAITDDLYRGAGQRVVVNYMGAFGAVAAVAGAEIWASGYYRSLRRLRLADMNDGEGRQYPRYYSLRLLGDIGVEDDLARVWKTDASKLLRTNTEAAKPLHAALDRGDSSASVATWSYGVSNITAASAHYNEAMHALGRHLHAMTPKERVDFMNGFLDRAAALASRLRQIDPRLGRATDISHQSAWVNAFDDWKRKAYP